MTDREIIIALAQALRWPVFDRCTPERDKPGCDSGPVPCIVESYHGNWFALLTKGQWSRWNPLESQDSAFAMQAAIPEDIRSRYLMALANILFAREPDADEEAWGFASASPRARCMAAIEAMK